MKRTRWSPSFFVLTATFVVISGEVAGASSSKLTADLVVINKTSRNLKLFRNNEAIKTYKVTFGTAAPGRKTCEGDNRTPEGHYLIDRRNKTSRYHIALHVSYPNNDDTRRAREAGCSAGGDIMIHGIRDGFGWIGPFHRVVNWTRGCVAVTNAEIEEIAGAVPDGTPVVINP